MEIKSAIDTRGLECVIRAENSFALDTLGKFNSSATYCVAVIV